MAYLKCNRCGSRRVIADRALAGKVICLTCGSNDIKKSSIKLPYIRSGKYNFLIVILITIVLLLVFNHN